MQLETCIINDLKEMKNKGWCKALVRLVRKRKIKMRRKKGEPKIYKIQQVEGLFKGKSIDITKKFNFQNIK